MKRKLTKEEEKLCKKGIENRKKRIKKMKEDLEYTRETKEFHTKWNDYLKRKADEDRKAKLEQLEKVEKYTIEGLKFEEKALINEKDQLKNGVEVKDKTKVPPGVN